ncbi:CDP-glycerol glycerophosphotransferase [Enterococcus sp. JM4C]|uniref:CDP-glycerol glycerophosphotransferase family protein n=1 Tax=Candidatus Enterococcus huntleyi TaxID=1857217 RepID=UPI00137B68AA|nr:CDP-glycerol glycerophosphotransferase family protein [Enterococcus sp. JM4C]KAF1297231.1 CDP-glycerol glycerophosphotransferase [Enterococcus sp. JM4C]
MNRLKKFAKELISQGYRILFNLNTKRQIDEQVIIFESFNGKVPGDNPLAIYQKLLDQPAGDFKIFWSIKPQFVEETRRQFPEISIVTRFSLQWLKLLPRAKFWIFNSRMPVWLKKNKNTTYIQTWHGTPLKKLALDIEEVHIPGNDTKKYQQEFSEEAARWDYLIAPNQYSEDIFKRAFQFKNACLEIGYPRNDVLYTENNTESILRLKEKILGRTSGKVILYAPTWRDDYFVSQGVYKFHMPFSLKNILDQMNPNDVFIIRPHYLVRDSIDIQGYEDRVKILVDEDISNLYLISDLLITDYSSVMFDYANLKRPMLFYPYDFEHYKDNLRGFYFEYNEVPGPIALTEEELLEYLKEFYVETYYEAFSIKYKQFSDRFCAWENGKAAERIVTLIKSDKV